MVVTIVVLLILAGVSISLVLNNNGIVQKSKEARTKYGEAKDNEQAQMSGVEDWVDNQVDGNGNSSKPTIEETKPYFPNGFTKEEGTSLDTGLVMKDSVGNEYVWIEVPRKKEVYTTAGLNITEFSEEELLSIKTDLIKYATDYRDSNYDDIWRDGCGVEEAEYSVMYNKMLKSVYQNGGFWIGRYEIGIDENTERNFGVDQSTEHPTTGQTPVIKKNKVPYNWIKCSQAEEIAETFAPTGYTSSLMFGLQWDLVCKHLETKGTNPGNAADSLQNAIKSNSNDWGNYSDASFTVTNADAMYSEDYGASWKKVSEETNKEYTKPESKILLTTGAEVRNSMLNIYDLAGNLMEFTLAGSLKINIACVSRGGYYYSESNTSPAYSYGVSNKDYSSIWDGARVTIY